MNAGAEQDVKGREHIEYYYGIKLRPSEKPSILRHNQKGFLYRFLLAVSLKQPTS